MRAVIQRVTASKVTVDSDIVGEIKKGINALIGIECGDNEEDVRYMADKIIGLRIFEDAEGKMNLSLNDIGGSILAISQFTLYGDARKGKRPSFTQAASFEEGKKLYDTFVEIIRQQNIPIQTGIYGADMSVEIINDGPVTILLDSKKTF